ncbi:MAG: glycosyltransferase family 4 protein [Capsulimonadaceae bacterium]
MTRIRILNVITHFALGGATEVVLTNCRIADSAQFETAILCGKTAGDEQSLLDEAVASGVPVHVVPSLRRAMSPVHEVRAYKDLVKWFRANRWDIVHTNGSKAGIIGRLAAAKAGVPVIVHTVFGWGHHDHMPAAMRRMFVALERRAARVTDRIITVSDANRLKGLADRIGVPDQYSVIYNAIDINKFRAVTVDRDALRQDLGIPASATVIGTVSRVAPQKAPEDFLKVARKVCSIRPEVHFVFVGGGPREREFRRDIEKLGLSNRVHALGYRNDVPQLLRTFDVFLLTSLWEGLPLVIPQAMCANLPTVATNVDGTPEVVQEGKTGFLADAHDVETLARRCVQLVDDPGLRACFAARTFDSVYPAFCDMEMVRRTGVVYRECHERKVLNGVVPAK